MAKIVGGFASSHSPLMGMTGPIWAEYAERDRASGTLVKPPEGRRVTYDQLLEEADPEIAKVINVEKFDERAENVQRGLDELKNRFTNADPDVVVMFGDDQGEWFFDDNMPLINVFWGKSIHMRGDLDMRGQKLTESTPEWRKVTSRLYYGSEDREYPVASDLGLHIIESLMDQDFDPAQTQYESETHGGKIGPANWYLDQGRSTPPRPLGLPHTFGFAIGRWWNDKTPPIVPISINTCYPPNWISPRRAFALGRAVRKAIEDWNPDARVAFATTGGLSHIVVDEELDRHVLKGLSEADASVLTTLPRQRVQSATTEILNWVAVAGAMGDIKMDVITYEPGYRTVAGTGCGLGVGSWL